ncbi:hypothetical protein [Streptomyces avermitilis]|uniref:SbtR family transcriptional regulator n=1 Tax=Streptomyces avermitilis TaxID=33903 RepID=UPI0038209B41
MGEELAAVDTQRRRSGARWASGRLRRPDGNRAGRGHSWPGCGARDLLAETTPYPALRTLLRELIAFQSAHHAVNDQLGGLDLPATTALRADLVRVVEEMIEGARRDGAVRTDLDPAVTTTLIGQTALAVARTQPPSPDLIDAYLIVLLDGLSPRTSA